MLLAVLVLTSVTSGVLSIPSVQTALANYGTSFLKDRYDVEVQIGRLQLRLPNHLEFREVFIPDDHGDTVIFAEHLRFDFGGFNSGKQLLLSPFVSMDGVVMKLYQAPGAEMNGFNAFIHKFSSPVKDTTGRPFQMKVSQIRLERVRFEKEIAGCDSCLNLDFHNGQVEINRFHLNGDYVTANIQNLTYRDPARFDVLTFKARAAYQPTYLELKELAARTTNSTLQADLGLRYRDESAFEAFLTEVELDGDFEKAELDAEEFRSYIPQFPALGVFLLSGHVEGPVEDLTTRNLDLELGTGRTTRLFGDLSLKNLTSGDSLWLDAAIGLFRTTAADARWLGSVFGLEEMPKVIDRLGTVTFNGHYTGTLYDFGSKGTLGSDAGSVDFRVSISADEQWADADYDAEASTKGLDLGGILEIPALGKLAGALSLKGNGLDRLSLNAALQGAVSRLEYERYAYTGISMDGRLKEGAFSGLLEVKDPNLDLRFDGEAGLGDTSAMDFTATVTHADLRALGFMEDSVANLSALVKLTAQGVSYTNWQGEAVLENATFENAGNFFFFRNIHLSSEHRPGHRVVKLTSDLASAEVRGDFEPVALSGELIRHFRRQLPLSDAERTGLEQKGSFTADINNIDLLTEIVLPDLKVDPGTRLEGGFVFGRTKDSVHLRFNTPEVKYKEYQSRNLTVSYSGSGKTGNRLNVEADRFFLDKLEADSLAIAVNRKAGADTAAVDAFWIIRDSIDTYADFSLRVTQPDTSAYGVRLDRSSFNIGTELFTIYDPNSILIEPERITVDQLTVHNGKRSLTAGGVISKDPNEILRITLDSIGTDLFEYFLGDPNTDISGNLDGEVVLSELLTPETKFGAQLRLDSLSLNNEWIGDMRLDVSWMLSEQTAVVDLVNHRGERKTLDIRGTVGLEENGKLDLAVELDRFRIMAFNPYLGGILTNLRGTATGKLNVVGARERPEVNGYLDLPNAAFTVGYTQVDYNLEGSPRIKVLPNRFELAEVGIRDTKEGTSGKVRGAITHNNYSDWKIDLSVDAERLLCLATDETHSDYYFGNAYTSGKIRMQGPTDELTMNIDVKTEKGTSFSIPMTSAVEVGETPFITFIGNVKAEEDTVEDTGRQIRIGGLSLVFNLDVTPDARIRIIMDEQAGDGLSATGRGLIRVTVGSDGDLGMYGTYTVEDGEYNFAISGLVNKKFTLEKGGTITWNGSPYEAQVDLQARYITKTSLSPPLSPESYTGGRTDVHLLLNLSGDLMNPNIGFKVKAPQVSTSVQSELDSYFGDPDRLNKQAFMLLVLNTFTQDNEILGQVNNAFSNNTTQMFTNQASNAISQALGTDFSFNYVGQGSNPNVSQEEVEVALSRKLLDDRVTVNGAVGVPVGSNQNSWVGDFEVVVNLTEDGRFRAKAFNRSNQDNQALDRLGEYTQGVGLFYTTDFDTYGELARKLFGAKPKEEKVPEAPADSTGNGQSAN